MNPTQVPKAKVNRKALKKRGTALTGALDAVCDAGSKSPEVTGSPIASAALADLKTVNGNAKTTFASHASLAVAYRASCKAVLQANADLDVAAGTYMGAVDTLAAGDPGVITRAGLQSRDGVARLSEAAIPTNVRGGPGKLSCQAIVRWDAAPGAAAYKLRVNFTPSDPTKWVELSSGRSRRRTVTAPTPGAQFSAEVASIGSEDTSDWSPSAPITAR